MKREDELPWYRQFWPWFIIALPGLTVIAGLVTFWIAVQSSDSLVVSSDVGMDIVTKRHAAAERRAVALGLDATVNIDLGSGAIIVAMRSTSTDGWPQTLDILFSHPTNAQLDRLITLRAAIPGDSDEPRWAGHVVPVPSGRWYLILSASDDWRLFGVWNGASSIRLRPPNAADDNGGR